MPNNLKVGVGYTVAIVAIVAGFMAACIAMYGVAWALAQICQFLFGSEGC